MMNAMQSTVLLLAASAATQTEAFVTPSLPVRAHHAGSSLRMVASTPAKGGFNIGAAIGEWIESLNRLPEPERIAKYVTSKSEWADTPDSTPTTEMLIGEEMVTDDKSASELADRCIAEAKRLFSSEEGWTAVLEEDGIFVEHKDIHGPYLKSNVRVVRGVGEIDANPDDLYNFQVSREGFQAIDEYLQHHRNVEMHKWITRPDYKEGEDYELMTNRVEWKYPTKIREFVALDIIDRKEKILISKSSLHPNRPGGSRYQDAVPLDEKEFVRAVQYYASKVEVLPNGKSLLRMVTWGEMCDDYSSFWVNLFNAHVFITPKFDRFRRAMKGEDVYETSNIIEVAWKLPKLLKVKPDAKGAAASDFVIGEAAQQKTGKQ
jgi:hypothetical protein